MLVSREETAAGIWQRIIEWAGTRSEAPLGEAPLPLGAVESPPTVWLEDKYDGIRCQLHKVGSRVSLYSRDLREITTTFLEVADLARGIPVSLILDGALVAMPGD